MARSNTAGYPQRMTLACSTTDVSCPVVTAGSEVRDWATIDGMNLRLKEAGVDVVTWSS